MKIKIPLFALLIIGFASCTKVDNNTTGSLIQPKAAFIVNGITDLTMVNNYTFSTSLYLTVQYVDSAQQAVSLSVSALPAGVLMDTTWQSSGYPNFSTYLVLYDSSATGATPGSYPVTVTATAASGEKKSYTFNLKILAHPTSYLGKYNNCILFCGSANYADSVYADASVSNKLWFSNFANSGHTVYGILSTAGRTITIPMQSFGSTYYSGTGTIYLPHQLDVSLTTGCSFDMN